MGIVVSMLLTGACSSTGECPQLPRLTAGAPNAAQIALSCVHAYEFGEGQYTPWCGRVRMRALGPVVAWYEDTNENVALRTIKGVPTAKAVALRISPGDGETDCGRWRFAPALGLETREAKKIARHVILERFQRTQKR